MAKLFGWVLGVVLLLGACGLLLDNEVSSDPGLVQETAGSGINASGSNEIDNCLALVADKPGDTQFVEAYGWKIVCTLAGDPDLGDSGDTVTLAYANFENQTIYLDATVVDDSIIAHESAHALEDIALTDELRLEAALALGEADWNEADSYWSTPAEMFAESRMGCLGYEVDMDFKSMSCSTIDAIIAKSDFAKEIDTLEKTAK
jgi:hypothetical protein